MKKRLDVFIILGILFLFIYSVEIITRVRFNYSTENFKKSTESYRKTIVDLRRENDSLKRSIFILNSDILFLEKANASIVTKSICHSDTAKTLGDLIYESTIKLNRRK